MSTISVAAYWTKIVRWMSTEVDLALGSDIERLSETVNGMSTDVDNSRNNIP